MKFFKILILLIGSTELVIAQSGIIGSDFANGWTNPSNIINMSAGAGASYIITRNPAGTGNQYFRLIRNSTTEMSPSVTCSPSQDQDISSNSSSNITINNAGHCTNSAWYINCPNTTDNYIFKVPSINESSSFVYFRVEGTVVTVSSVSRNPTNVYPGLTATVTATLSGSFSTGQAAYMRYTTNAWSTSTVVLMTGSGTSYTAVIPASANTPSANISYYIFTSGPTGVTSDGSNADFYSINVRNNSGSNYSYTVQSGWTTTSTGNWSTASNWNASAVPPTSENLGTVTIAHNLTLNQNAIITGLTINSSVTLTSQSSNSRIISINSGGTINNNGTFLPNDGKIIFNGTGTVTGTITFNNIDISGIVDFGTNSTINGTLTINSGGSVNTNAPFYAINSNLKYASDYQLASEWYANMSSGQGVPYNVIIDGGNVYMFTGAAQPRYLNGTLTINSGKTFSLSQTVSGDLYIAGDWNNNGTFVSNSRTVYFNGTSAQNINTDAPFTYVTIDNNTTFKANITVQYLTINSNKSFISQTSSARTMTIPNGGSITNNGTFTANDGKVIFSGTGTVNGIVSFYNVDLNNSGGNPGVDFNTNSTITGTLTINANGSCNINAPTYATGSTLKYNPGGHYDRRVEWSAQTGRGYPYHIQISNNTEINIGYESPGVQKECAGNLTIDAGSALFMDYGTDDMTQSLIIKGDLFLNGSLSLSDQPGGDFEIYGNWNRTGTFTPKSRMVTFKSNSNQAINNNTSFDYLKINNTGGAIVTLADNISLNQNAYVENGAIFNLSTYIISGTGTFENKSGGTIKIGSLQGITSSGATGNVQTSTRIFNQDAIYHYIGTTDQATGNGLQSPLYSGGKVIVELNTISTILTSTNAINSNAGSELKIIQGTLIENGSGTRFYGSADLTMTGGIYKFLTEESVYPDEDNEYCPKLTGTYNLTGGTIELAAVTNATYQVLKGNRNYYNVKISGGSSGGGYKSVSTALTISNSLIITDGTTIFDTKNFSLSGDGGLIMDAGKYRISKLTNSQPELTGINTAYAITGGTVEFYGSNSSQQQLIRGNFGSPSSRITYFNLDLNSISSNVSFANPGNINASESFSIGAGGTVTVFSPTVFRLDETDYIDGAGNVTVNAGAALFYGSPNGIKTTGVGVNDGNIRISGTRSFSSTASYGFISSGNMNSGNALPVSLTSLYIYKTNATDVITINNAGFAVTGKVIFNKGILLADISNLITFNDEASVHTNEAGNNNLPGSDNSFIKGPSKKIGNDAFTFPTGDIQGADYVWAPIEISAPGLATDDFIAQYNFKSASTAGFTTWNNGSNMESGLDYVSDIEYWEITKGAGVTSTPMVTLYWKNAVRSDIANSGSSYTFLNDLTVAHWNTNKWENMGGDATISSTYPTGQISSTVTFPNYSPITFGSKTGKNPLPVTLTKFSGNCINEGYQINWLTESEINNDYFLLQKCNNNSCIVNNEWINIATITGAGNSNETIKYQYIDFGFAGSAYYRLLQYDFDDNSKTSSVIYKNCIKPEIEDISFGFDVNEKSIQVRVTSSLLSKLKFTIADITGKIISQNNYSVSSGMSYINVDVSLLSAGLYLMNVSDESSAFLYKFFIK